MARKRWTAEQVKDAREHLEKFGGKLWSQVIHSSSGSLWCAIQYLAYDHNLKQIVDVSAFVAKVMDCRLDPNYGGVRTDMGDGEFSHYLGVALYGEHNMVNGNRFLNVYRL